MTKLEHYHNMNAVVSTVTQIKLDKKLCGKHYGVPDISDLSCHIAGYARIKNKVYYLTFISFNNSCK